MDNGPYLGSTSGSWQAAAMPRLSTFSLVLIGLIGLRVELYIINFCALHGPRARRGSTGFCTTWVVLARMLVGSGLCFLTFLRTTNDRCR